MFFLDWHTLECLENQKSALDLTGNARGMSPVHLSLCQDYVPFTIQMQQQKIPPNFTHISKWEFTFHSKEMLYPSKWSTVPWKPKLNRSHNKLHPLFRPVNFFQVIKQTKFWCISLFFLYSPVVSPSCNSHSSPHHLSHCSGITSVLSSTLCCWFPARLLLLQLFQATASIRVAESVLFHHVGCSDLHWRLQKAKVQHTESTLIVTVTSHGIAMARYEPLFQSRLTVKVRFASCFCWYLKA